MMSHMSELTANLGGNLWSNDKWLSLQRLTTSKEFAADCSDSQNLDMIAPGTKKDALSRD